MLYTIVRKFGHLADEQHGGAVGVTVNDPPIISMIECPRQINSLYAIMKEVFHSGMKKDERSCMIRTILSMAVLVR